MQDIISLLEVENPKFHLESLTLKVPNAEDFFFKNGRAETNEFSRTSYAIGKDILKYIDSIVSKDTCTMETGGGASTVVFTVKSKQHTCINPDKTSNQLIKGWLDERGYDSTNLNFIEDSSDIGLAKLALSEKKPSIDVALIDGSHSFPFPVVDWHFIDTFLVMGGKLLVDDTQINSVRILTEFLELEPSYKKINEFGKCSVFEKTVAARSVGWIKQGINNRDLHWFK